MMCKNQTNVQGLLRHILLQLFTLLPTLGYFLFPLCIGQKVVEIGDEESAMVVSTPLGRLVVNFHIFLPV